MIDTVTAADTPTIENPRKRWMVRTAWIVTGIFFLLVFTIAKLPEDRIKNYIDGSINAALAQRGMTMQATESRLSYLFGVRYTLEDVTVQFPPPTPPAKLEKIQVSPSLLPLLLGKLAGKFYIEQGDGSFKGSFSMKNSKGAFSFQSKQINLGKLGLLPLATGLQGSAILSGDGNVSGDFADLTTLEGKIRAEISKATIDQQLIMGFSIPKISLSEAQAEIQLGRGKAMVKHVRLGKTGNPMDDIQGMISGEITLGRVFQGSTLDLKARFSLSENILKSFVLLDAILGSGKQADGSYAFKLAGPITAPFPTPEGK